MSSRFVRASKFRHVYAEPSKPEAQYVDLDLAPTTGDHNYIRGNGKFFAVAVRGGGGPVLVLPYSATGKLPRGYPVVNGHSAAVYDTAWNPFNDNVLATGSDDTTVKLWSIPDGGLTESIKDPLTTLSGHGKPVALLQWHPTANHVLASVGKDPAVKIWDVEKGAARNTIDAFGGLVQDIAFNSSGSLLATSCKDRAAKIFDPRATVAASEWTPHEGGKAFKILFLGETGQVITVGFTKQSKREMKLWDLKSLGAAMTTIEIDQAAGVMMPFYDEDLRMLYLTGKGDGNVRYYELTDEAPHIFFLSEHRTNVSTKGADFLPKRAMSPLRCEVARMLKLTSDAMEPISFIVPRKSEAFQEDIFPDTYAGVPSQTADAFFGGNNAMPKLVSMDPAKAGAGPTAAAAFKPTATAPAPAAAAPAPAASPQSTPKSSTGTPAGGSGSTGGAGASSAELDAAVKRAKAAEDRAKAAEAQVVELKAALSAAQSAAASGGGDSAALAEELASTKAALAAAEGKLKQLAAIINA